MMGAAKLFLNGIPTGPDVEKLMERFGVPQPGVIPYADIEAVLGKTWRDHRFTTVRIAWLKRLQREHNVSTEMEPGVGVRVLAEAERIGKSVKGLRRGTRHIRKAAIEVRSIRTDRLTAVERVQADNTARVAMALYEAGAQGVKSLAPPRPLPQIPRGVSA